MQENVTELEGTFEKFLTHVHSVQGGKHPVPNLRGVVLSSVARPRLILQAVKDSHASLSPFLHAAGFLGSLAIATAKGRNSNGKHLQIAAEGSWSML